MDNDKHNLVGEREGKKVFLISFDKERWKEYFGDQVDDFSDECLLDNIFRQFSLDDTGYKGMLLPKIEQKAGGRMMSKEERKSLDRLYQEMVDKSETIEWAGVRYAIVRLQILREAIKLRAERGVIDEKSEVWSHGVIKTKKIFKKVVDSIINLSLGDCMILTVDDKRYKVIRIDAREVE